MSPLTVRDETARDQDAVCAVHRSAFADEAVVRIVDDLRRSEDAVISMVAEHGADIVGHVLFSELQAPMRALTLSPLGVRRDFQRAGVGSALVHKGLERARQDGWQAVFVLGSPATTDASGSLQQPLNVTPLRVGDGLSWRLCWTRRFRAPDGSSFPTHSPKT
jgi:predicted N-acetyltransferase YhbS